jgi:cellulose synthase (UDP-forming)
MLRWPEPQLPSLRPLIAGKHRLKYAILIAVWAMALVFFWQWWLRPEHNASWLRYGPVTVILAWLTLLEIYVVYFFLRAVRSNAPDPRPGQWRVAMIVTKTPSEPFAVLRQTLEAMLTQDYPHDTWLADEDPSQETLAWCARHGVRVSTRKGREDYHRKTWPRRTRCKEGNLAFFYDHWGYELYDIVVQLDADHVPQPGYLVEMLRPFADADVGYVSAPSICASNAPENWSARTRLQTEGAFHGILQAGYSNGFAPMCIGSHYAVRTCALREVGGLGPELAEDHSTTMILNAGGWRGVHAMDAIAIGDGPATVADMVTQEFQWSRSLVTLLLQYSPHYFRKMPRRLRWQFLFCQMYYPLSALALALMFLMPIVALLTDTTYANVTFPAYVGHALPSVLALVAIAYTLKSDDFFRPSDAPVLSWEKMLFVPLQWPWVFWGCLMAVRDRLTGRFVDFRITPKGEAARGRIPTKVLAVYFVLALICLFTVLSVEDVSSSGGFYLLALVNGMVYVAALTVTVVRHYLENGWEGLRKDAVPQFALVVALVGLTGFSFTQRSAEGAYALAFGLGQVQIARPLYMVAGAGNGPGTVHYGLDLGWN